MPSPRTYKISAVANKSGVSIRALHHYDAIGLLVPSGRSEAGYRLYSDDDLLRLQQILLGRELGLPLEEIGRSLDDPGFDRRRALLAQRALLAERVERAAAMLQAIDAALAVIDETATTTEGQEVDMKKIFDGFDPGRYADEAKRRWGDTDAYSVSMQRANAYTEADWGELRDEQASIYAAAFAALEAGIAPNDPRAMDAAERHRLSIDRWFYPCSATMHCGLADLYEADSRFAASIDAHGQGLTKYLVAAIRANAKRAGA